MHVRFVGVSESRNFRVANLFKVVGCVADSLTVRDGLNVADTLCIRVRWAVDQCGKRWSEGAGSRLVLRHAEILRLVMLRRRLDMHTHG